ncbi:hypothetical protein KCU65_g9872, partial [Aureobasidium melanogenum]
MKAEEVKVLKGLCYDHLLQSASTTLGPIMDTDLVAKFLAIPCGFLMASYNATFSQNVMPHLYTQPASVVAPIFAKIYKVGFSTMLPLASTAIVAYSYLAYSSTPRERQLYGTAAALTFVTLPMTQIIMMPTISRLQEISESGDLQAAAGANQEVTKLVKTWVTQNYFRASIHLTAGFIGLFAALT